MIAFLNGTVAAVLPPQTAYIDVAGVGYAVAMPGATWASWPWARKPACSPTCP